MNGYEQIIYRKEASVAVIRLNRPEALNAFTPQMGVEIKNALENAEQDKEIGAIILTGEGKAFCSGADMKGFQSRILQKIERPSFPPILSSIMFNLKKPIIGAVNGPAVGLGFTLLLPLDIRIASEKAKFGAVFLRVGLIPEFGSTVLLPRLIGLAKASELVFTTRIIDAQEAERIGLVNRVVPHESLMAETLEMAKAIAEGPPEALSLAKEGLRRAIQKELKAALEWERNALKRCREGKEHAEGVKAFLEKRKPRFRSL